MHSSNTEFYMRILLNHRRILLSASKKNYYGMGEIDSMLI